MDTQIKEQPVTQYVSSRPMRRYESVFDFIYRHVDLGRFKLQITETNGANQPCIHFEVWSKGEEERLVFHKMLRKNHSDEGEIIVITTHICRQDKK